MEESEKRRERLKAMRMEAAQVGGNTDSPSAQAGLSNPLIESETPAQCTSSRFDYYTDPVAAFNGSRRRNNISPQVSQGHYNTPPRAVYQGMNPPPPPPVYQNTAVNYPDQRVFQAPPPVYQNRPVNYPDQRTFQVPRPHFSQGPLAHFSQNRGAHFDQNPVGIPAEATGSLGRPRGNHPNAWGGSGGINYSTPPNYSRGGNNFSGSGFRQGDSHVNYGRGRGQWFNSRPHYDSGRGRGWRGAGSHNAVSAELRPDLYYKKEMVEDPWRMLTPVIWKSDQSWLPKSIGMKKAKVSTEAAQTSISQQSLAEYLATSFNDSTSEAVDEPSS